MGRGVWASPIDRRVLGDMEASLRTVRGRIRGLPSGMWLTSRDLHSINRLRWNLSVSPYKTLGTMIARWLRAHLLGERMAANGSALVIRLFMTLREMGVPLWLSTPMRTLVTDETGRVIGVEAERNGRTFRIGARYGVMVATGGFENNPEMRLKYLATVGTGWSTASPDNQGDGQRAGEAIGAALELMSEAWWSPVIKLPGTLFGSVAERQYPRQFIVNSLGLRFVNEASPYVDFGRAQIAAHETGVSHIPAYMIIDDGARKRNFICGHFPGRAMPTDWLSSGLVKKADTVEGLAEQLAMPPENLRHTLDRFNDFARHGRDDDFHRGDSVYEHFYGDPSQRNPNLMELSTPPFYSFEVYPGDLGTKGGLLTDEDARVLKPDGSVIPGLYACGNASASVMGNDYPGPGATIGAAMTFAWVGGRHIAQEAAETSGAARTTVAALERQAVQVEAR
jgi:3-oxosteroid 1-dehydrogenase